MIDYHVHELHSRDAPAATIAEYIHTADLKGIKEIAFTTHFITIGPDVDISIKETEIPRYIEDIKQAQDNTRVHLLTGLEVDYFPEDERHIERVLSTYDFDFILGSIHNINGFDLGLRSQSEKFFMGRTIAEAADEYYTLWTKAAETGLFDVMAHPDYWRKYLHFFGKKSDWGDFGSKVYDALQTIGSIGVGIEVNTSGERAGTGNFYPILEFLIAAREAGIEKVTVGSDSHTPTTLGYRVNEATKMLRDAGFKGLSLFKKHKSKLIPFTDTHSI